MSDVDMVDQSVAKPSFQDFNFMQSAIIAMGQLMGFQSAVYCKTGTNKTPSSFLPNQLEGKTAQRAPKPPLICLLSLLSLGCGPRTFIQKLGAMRKIIWRQEINGAMLIGGRVKMRLCFMTAP